MATRNAISISILRPPSPVNTNNVCRTESSKDLLSKRLSRLQPSSIVKGHTNVQKSNTENETPTPKKHKHRILSKVSNTQSICQRPESNNNKEQDNPHCNTSQSISILPKTQDDISDDENKRCVQPIHHIQTLYTKRLRPDGQTTTELPNLVKDEVSEKDHETMIRNPLEDLPLSTSTYKKKKLAGKHKVSGTEKRIVAELPRRTTRNFAPSFPKTIAIASMEFHVIKHILSREQLHTQLRSKVRGLETLVLEYENFIKEMFKGDFTSVNNEYNPEVIIPIQECSREDNAAENVLGIESAPKELGEKSNTTSVVVKGLKLVTPKETTGNIVNKIIEQVNYMLQLILSIQEATMNAVEAITRWRVERAKHWKFTNYTSFHRFSWTLPTGEFVENYLLHLQEDILPLYKSKIWVLIAGKEMNINPLLLPAEAMIDIQSTAEGSSLRKFHNPCSNKSIFVTELTKDPSPPEHSTIEKLCEYTDRLRGRFFVASTKKIELLKNSKFCTLDIPRISNCLAIIAHEKTLEQEHKDRMKREKQRIQNIQHDPFATIKEFGSVENVLSNFLANETQYFTQRAQELRARGQQVKSISDKTDRDTTIVGNLNESKKNDATTNQFIITASQLRDHLTARTEFKSSTMMYEHLSHKKTSRLNGMLFERTPTIGQLRQLSARRIQKQVQVHLLRRLINDRLKYLVHSKRKAVAILRRFFHRLNQYIDHKKITQEQERHQIQNKAAIVILQAFRRFKRQKKHQSLASGQAQCVEPTLVGIAQAELAYLQAQKELNSDEYRYRRIGEQRRLQQLREQQKRKEERLILEQQQNAAALQIQCMVRASLARRLLQKLYHEREQHRSAVSAFHIQSQIRLFLKQEYQRRERFRADYVRVNKFAVRIQSLYRGFKTRTQQSERRSSKDINEFALPILHTSRQMNEKNATRDKITNLQLLKNITKELSNLPPIKTLTPRSISNSKKSKKTITPQSPLSHEAQEKRDAKQLKRHELKLKDAKIGAQF